MGLSWDALIFNMDFESIVVLVHSWIQLGGIGFAPWNEDLAFRAGICHLLNLFLRTMFKLRPGRSPIFGTFFCGVVVRIFLKRPRFWNHFGSFFWAGNSARCRLFGGGSITLQRKLGQANVFCGWMQMKQVLAEWALRRLWGTLSRRGGGLRDWDPRDLARKISGELQSRISPACVRKRVSSLTYLRCFWAPNALCLQRPHWLSTRRYRYGGGTPHGTQLLQCCNGLICWQVVCCRLLNSSRFFCLTWLHVTWARSLLRRRPP